MSRRIAILGLVMTIFGCGPAEPERPRVVPATVNTTPQPADRSGDNPASSQGRVNRIATH